MNTPNKILMTQARETLSDKWGMAIVTYLVYGLLSSATGWIPFGSLIFSGPLSLGLVIFSLKLSRKQDPDISQLFDGFKKFEVSFLAYLLMMIFVILWSLLLIVPGIIAAISYSQVFYIISENDSIDAMTALRKSQQLMKGKKWKYFCLWCRFIGWFILCLLTLGIGFLWLIPYMQVSHAKFYDDIKN